MIAKIPEDTFAPNVLISGLFARWGYLLILAGVGHGGFQVEAAAKLHGQDPMSERRLADVDRLVEALVLPVEKLPFDRDIFRRRVEKILNLGHGSPAT